MFNLKISKKSEEYIKSLNNIEEIRRKKLSPEIQWKLVENRDVYILKHLAKNPNLIPELQSLKGFWYKDVPITPELQWKLIENGDSSVLENLISNPSISPEVQWKLVETENCNILKKLAFSTNLITELQSLKGLFDINIPITPELQWKLFENGDKNEDKFILQNLARNPSLITDIQWELIENGRVYLLELLAENKSLIRDTKAQLKLLENGDSYVLFNLARNPSLVRNLEVQLILFKSGNDDVLENLARNPSLLPKLQRDLIQGASQDILKNLLKNPNLNKDLINEIFEKLKITEGEEFKSIDSQNFNLHKYKKNEDKYKEIKPQIESLENQLENEQDNQKRNKIINKINRLKNSIPEYEIYENLDDKLTSNDGKTFISQERTWSKGSGQNFTNSDEKVILLYPSKDILKESLQDPLLKKFFDSYWAGSHFNDKTSPIGWALIYEYDKNTWIINQIQSDIVSQFLRIYNNAKNNTQNSEKPKIDTEELAIILKTNNRSGYIELLNQPQYSNVLEQLLYHPEEINGLPEANTIEEAQNNVQEVQRIQQDLVNRGHLSVNENDQLSDLSIEQLDYIREKLNYIINEWYYHVFQNVWLQAKENGVTDLYMNTSKSLSGGANEGKSIFLYEKLPKELGFVKENVNLRGQEEKFWYRKASFNLKSYRLIFAQNKNFIEERDEAFNRMADAQRQGEPEKLGTQWNQEIPFATGLYTNALEHIGDITHRLGENFSYYHGQYAIPKVKMMFNDVSNPYGFKKEIVEQIQSNLKYEDSEIPLEEAIEKTKEYGQKYANAHRQIPIFNELQKNAREAAIALGEWRFSDVEKSLQYIIDTINNNTFIEKAGEYNNI